MIGTSPRRPSHVEENGLQVKAFAVEKLSRLEVQHLPCSQGTGQQKARSCSPQKFDETEGSDIPH